ASCAAQYSASPSPAPPKSPGTVRPSRPCSANTSTISSGVRPSASIVRSHSGLTFFSIRPRTNALVSSIRVRTSVVCPLVTVVVINSPAGLVPLDRLFGQPCLHRRDRRGRAADVHDPGGDRRQIGLGHHGPARGGQEAFRLRQGPRAAEVQLREVVLGDSDGVSAIGG